MHYIREIIFLLDDDYRKLPGLVLIFILASMLDLAGLGLIGPYVSAVIEPENFLNSNISNTFVRLGFSADIKNILLLFGAVLIGIFLLKAIMAIFINWVILGFITKRDIKMRSYLMDTYQQLSYSEYINRNSSEYIHTINNRVGGYTGGVLQPALKIMSDGIIGIVVLGLLAWINGPALAILVLLLGVTATIYDLASRRKVKLYGEKVDSNVMQMLQGIQEGIEGLKEIRILGIESYFYNKVTNAAKETGKNSLNASLISTAPKYLLEFILILFIVLIVFLSFAINEGVTTLAPTLGVFGVASLRLIPMANQMVTGISQLRYNRVATSRLYEDLKSLKNQKSKQLLRLSEKDGSELFNSLVFKNVSFDYSNTNRKNWILNNLSFSIKRGESIGLIGVSGSGKTTLLDVLLGLLKPQKGDILFNDRSLKESLHFWRAQVAYLPQEIFLIDNTLKSNVALGVPNEKIDRVNVINALKQARLDELIKELPKGVDTIIGERGIRLSGGQKQRVALARAFYHGRNVLVLDEATSSLDNETEKEIVEEIRLLKGEKTLIVIAHRLTTVQHCDRIYVLEKGEIINEGPPEKILNMKKI